MTEIKITVSECENKKCCFSNIRFYLTILFHLVAVCVFFLVNIYAGYIWMLLITDRVVIDNPSVLNVKWFSPLFLTNWNFMFQTCFLSMSLVYDMMQWMDRHDSKLGRKLKYYRDVMFSGLIVPLTMFISSMFWTVYWIDRELVFPEVYDQLVPWWFNHCVHTNILIVIGVETVLQARRHPTNLKVELWLNTIAGVSYAVVYYTIYFCTHRWLYGVFGVMTWWQVCIYQLMIWASTFLFYAIQFPVNRLFHRKNVENSPETQNTEKKFDSNGFSSNSWNPNVRSKEMIENSSL